MKKKIFVPGETIASEEEYLAGENTFVDNGLIKASGLGEAIFDEENKEVFVKSKSVSNLRENDVVVGKVVLVKDAVVVVEIINSEEKRILTMSKGQIPAKFASNNYTANAKKVFKVGDVVRARVLSANDLAVDLSTSGQGFGVTIAYCSNCRNVLTKTEGKLICFDCGNVETRKWFEDSDVRTESNFGRRNNFSDRNSFGKDSFGKQKFRQKEFGQNRFRGNKR